MRRRQHPTWPVTDNTKMEYAMLSTLPRNLAVALLLAGSGTALAQGKGGFEFALIGDAPYAVADYPKFDREIDVINDSRRVQWVLHVGDIKTGSSPCSDELFSARFETFQRFERPFVLTPGDNEWTDCHRAPAGGYAPLERLARLRQIFYPQPGLTLGQRPMRVDSQSSRPGFEEFVENVRWTRANVVFAGLHIVGSNNGLAPFAGRTVADDEEVVRRNAANLAWLRETFAVAAERRSPGVFLFMQANPGFEAAPDSPERRGFEDFLLELERQVVAFGKPVVLAHGDSHYFRVDKPLNSSITGRMIENFTRVETFGSANVHWLRVAVNPRDSEVFQVRQEIIPDNLRDHPLP